MKYSAQDLYSSYEYIFILSVLEVEKMPYRDGTGPDGLGPTGWGLGGCRRGYGRASGRGYGRVAGRGFRRYGAGIPIWDRAPTRDEELSELREEKKELERELQELKKRMDELD